jgi:hypothetical protein
MISLISEVKGISQVDAAKLLTGELVPDSRNSSSSSRTVPQDQKGQSKPPTFDPEAYAAKLDLQHEALKPLGLELETLKEWKAGYASAGLLRGCLALPIHRNGSITGYIGRAIDGNLKFPTGFDPAAHIFGLHLASGEVRLVRDPLEVLHAYQVGEPAIAFLTQLIEAQQWELLVAAQDAQGFKVLL